MVQVRIGIDREWTQAVHDNLYQAQDATLGGRNPARDGRVTQVGQRLARDLREKYREGESLCIPGDNDWLIGPELLLNQDVDIGNFEDPTVLAVVAARDPASAMSLAATARLTPRARKSKLVPEILGEVARSSLHDDVRICIDYAARRSFAPGAQADLERVIRDRINDIRTDCFVKLKNILRDLLETDMAPAPFIDQFFTLSERSRIRGEVYKSMVMTLILSRKIRPMVKVLLINNLGRMPRRVQLDVIAAVSAMPADAEAAYVKTELSYVIEESRRSERLQ
jgi:hypothetical protein